MGDALFLLRWFLAIDKLISHLLYNAIKTKNFTKKTKSQYLSGCNARAYRYNRSYLYFLIIVGMFHFISGTVLATTEATYITNSFIGIQVTYQGQRTEGNFFLYPIIDEHSKTIKYYAFDSDSQKNSFSSVLKISGIWPKIAYEIARADPTKLTNAINTFDVAFFQSIPGIWPKTAKKVLVELKSSFSDKDLIKINADDKIVKNIIKTLGAMGYDKNKVMTTLATYDGEISQDTLSHVLQRLVQHITV